MTLIIIFILLGVIGSAGRAVNRAYRSAQTLFGGGRAPAAAAGGPLFSQRREEKAQPRGIASPVGAGKREAVRAPLSSPRSERGGVRNELGRIFREEEQLLAAFIFHEVLGPPRSLRRR